MNIHEIYLISLSEIGCIKVRSMILNNNPDFFQFKAEFCFSKPRFSCIAAFISHRIKLQVTHFCLFGTIKSVITSNFLSKLKKISSVKYFLRLLVIGCSFFITIHAIKYTSALFWGYMNPLVSAMNLFIHMVLMYLN